MFENFTKIYCGNIPPYNKVKRRKEVALKQLKISCSLPRQSAFTNTISNVLHHYANPLKAPSFKSLVLTSCSTLFYAQITTKRIMQKIKLKYTKITFYKKLKDQEPHKRFINATTFSKTRSKTFY